MQKNIANWITCIRIACSIALLFFPALSPVFYALYIAAGLSDMADGFVARKTHTESPFGAKLDTAADLIMFAACLYKLIPVMGCPLWIWIWVGAIALIKIVNVVSGCVMYKKLLLPHTLMNKITGVLLFLFPLTFTFTEVIFTAPVVCAVATVAAVQEGHYIRTGKET